MSTTSFKFRVSNLQFEASPRRINSKLETRNSKLRSSAGATLVELIVFIVVVSVAVAGVLAAIGFATRSSADPVIQKQALAIAEAMLEEVQLMPFSYCDPNDPAAPTAASITDCATQEAIGPEGGETRYDANTPFDNVNDYNGFTTTAAPSGIRDISGVLIAGLDGYRVTVNVARQALQGVDLDANGAAQSLLVTITVTGPGDTTLTLHGYRLRYAPNATLP